MEPRFETFQGDVDETLEQRWFGWRLVDGNGEIVANSEGYTRRADAERGIRNVITTVVDVLVLHDAIIAQHLMPDHVGIVDADAADSEQP